MNFFRQRKSYQKQWRGLSIEVTRKDIKNLYVRINRRTGKIRVSSPNYISERGIEQFLDSRLSWIEKHLTTSSFHTEQEKAFQYITGEEHYFLGKRYQLEVKDDSNSTNVYLEEGRIHLKIRGTSTVEKRKKVLEDWYRFQLQERIPEFVHFYESKMNVEVNEYRIKKMKTRWGSCNIRAKRIWLSLELAKRSEGCLEMVIVHEMVHLFERLHNKRFYKLMDVFMPNWREFETELRTLTY